MIESVSLQKMAAASLREGEREREKERKREREETGKEKERGDKKSNV